MRTLSTLTDRLSMLDASSRLEPQASTPPSIVAFITSPGAFTVTTPADDNYTVYVQAPGGSGAVASAQLYDHNASGGGSGTTVKSFRALMSKGLKITGVNGSGGAPVSNIDTNGRDGASSTCTLPDGRSMTVPAGKGGVWSGAAAAGGSGGEAPTGKAVELFALGLAAPVAFSSVGTAGNGAASPSAPLLFGGLPGGVYVVASGVSQACSGAGGSGGAGATDQGYPAGNNGISGAGGDGVVMIVRG